MTGAIERIIVALDATAETRTTIDTAVRLAARAKTSLHVVFVEDEDLLSLAALSVARQVIAGVGATRLTTDEVELQLRAAATRAREAVHVAARTHALECSFEIVRGAVETALASASEHDLVVAGGLARPVAGHLRVESGWLAALELAPGSFLLARERPRKTGGVCALVRERSAGSARLLQSATRLAELAGGALTVLCPPSLVTAKNFAKWVDEQIMPTTARVEVLAAAEAAALGRHIAASGYAVLAVEASAAEGDRLKEFSRSFGGDLLVVR
jgi:hypothetical protein